MYSHEQKLLHSNVCRPKAEQMPPKAALMNGDHVLLFYSKGWCIWELCCISWTVRFCFDMISFSAWSRSSVLNTFFFFCYMNKALVLLCCLCHSLCANAQQTSSSFYKITFWGKDVQERTFPICLDCSRHVLFLSPCWILGCKKSKSNQQSRIVYMCHMRFSQ